MPKYTGPKTPGPSMLHYNPRRGMGGSASWAGWGRDIAPPGKNVAVPEHKYGLGKKWISYKGPGSVGSDGKVIP